MNTFLGYLNRGIKRERTVFLLVIDYLRLVFLTSRFAKLLVLWITCSKKFNLD